MTSYDKTGWRFVRAALRHCFDVIVLHYVTAMSDSQVETVVGRKRSRISVEERRRKNAEAQRRAREKKKRKAARIAEEIASMVATIEQQEKQIQELQARIRDMQCECKCQRNNQILSTPPQTPPQTPLRLLRTPPQTPLRTLRTPPQTPLRPTPTPLPRYRHVISASPLPMSESNFFSPIEPEGNRSWLLSRNSIVTNVGHYPSWGSVVDA